MERKVFCLRRILLQLLEGENILDVQLLATHTYSTLHVHEEAFDHLGMDERMRPRDDFLFSQ